MKGSVMIIRTVVRHGRRMWELDNGALTLAIAVGGGHLAELRLAVRPEVNPFWIPPWKSMEPWSYRPPVHDRRYGEKLLASILGHNLCLSYFGPPSEEEKTAGAQHPWRSAGRALESAGKTDHEAGDRFLLRVRSAIGRNACDSAVSDESR